MQSVGRAWGVRVYRKSVALGTDSMRHKEAGKAFEHVDLVWNVEERNVFGVGVVLVALEGNMCG